MKDDDVPGGLDLRAGADDAPEPRKSRLKRWGKDLGVTVALLLAVWLGLGWLRAPDLPAQAPPFALATLDGKQVELADYAGKTVVLNFWATWCAPCRVEIPTFSKFARNHPDIPVLGIAVDGTPEQLREAAPKLGIDYPVLVADAATRQAYGVSTLPTTVVVNPDGTVRTAHAGLMIGPHLWWITR